MQWYFYIGLIAAICIAAFNFPQLIQVIKTKNTCGMSVIMLLILLGGDIFFVLNGIGILADKDMEQKARISAGLPLLLANLIATIMTATLLFFKLRAIRWAKKFEITEKEYCENYDSYRTKRKMIHAEKAAAKEESNTKDTTPPVVAGE